mmetsp:Transcript_19816/g.40581  ORF Transcript_19816/g.40581 Transcript_19816/m.40581 type:complete len:100 (-) Transcript_19816:306-605(-)
MVYEPFFYRTSGDHRGFYIDFEISSLFSTVVPTFGTSSRGFSTKDRKAVTTYLTKFQAHMEANTKSNNKTLKYPLGPWTNHHSMAGPWQSYQLHDTILY